MYCSNCGKEIRDGSAFCSECGAPQAGGDGRQERAVSSGPVETKADASYNTMCIIGAVVSGLSLFFSFFGLTGIGGIILSGIGLRQIGETGERGRELAIAGIVVGAITAVYGIIMLVVSWNMVSSLFSMF